MTLLAGLARAADEPVAAHIAVAVALPPDVPDVALTARHATEKAEVALVDDGSFAFDLAGDGEWWALLNPQPGANAIVVTGTAGGARLEHTEVVTVPAAWQTKTYPVSMRASLADGAWTVQRVFPTELPDVGGPTGVGIAGGAEAAGLSPAALYLAWGAFCLVLVATAALRAAVLRAGGKGPT
ncbi:MAG: hypothetical protein ACOZNI_25205 [Myxococcota bacterium]